MIFTTSSKNFLTIVNFITIILIGYDEAGRSVADSGSALNRPERMVYPAFVKTLVMQDFQIGNGGFEDQQTISPLSKELTRETATPKGYTLGTLKTTYMMNNPDGV